MKAIAYIALAALVLFALSPPGVALNARGTAAAAAVAPDRRIHIIDAGLGNSELPPGG